MATKTFKIGEHAKGGIIKVITTENSIKISVIDMYTNEGELSSQKTVITDYDRINSTSIESRISVYLHDNTTAYYTDKIKAWIKEKTGINFIWC